MSKIDLQNSRWCEIVFETRNREYGAYALRRDYSCHTLKALVIAILSFGLCAYAPILAGIIGKTDNVKTEMPDTTPGMTDINIDQPEEIPPVRPELPPPPAVKEIRFTTPEVVPEELLQEEDLLPPAESIPDDVIFGDETREGLSRFEVPIDAGEDGEGTEKIVGQVTDKPFPFATIETKPQFPGGMDKLLPYVMKRIHYPAVARENNLEGTVFVQFTIDRDGSITDVRAVRGQDLGGGLADEALRVIRAMPRWKPGEQNGQKVKVSYTMPVIFRLQK